MEINIALSNFKKEDLSENFNLNGIDVKLDVEKIAQ